MPYALEPHVAGELGDATVMDPSTHPPVVTDVEYVLDTPHADDLIESFPVFLVTQVLATALTGVAGVSFGRAELRPGDRYLETYGDVPHPAYVRLLIAGGPDIWIGDDLLLHVSDRLMALLSEFNLTYCDVTRAS